MGSQSSRIAAYLMGFDFYGWEIDEEYFNEGQKRFSNAITQLKIQF
jgi:site-specific DNA-methyltransferase (adenine-specific)